MGYNSVVVILNDCLHVIEKDPSFGKSIADAIGRKNCYGPDVDISSGNCGNAATVIGCEHADVTQIIAVGRNYGETLARVGGLNYHTPEGKIHLLKCLADELGYRISKKPTKG